jgi:4-hydroxybenzoyl-CoA thioesterase/acyl-CoA thioester hydrolase
MADKFVTTRRVEFCETDAAGIVHFASYLCYMEQAEHEFLRSLGLTVSEPQDDGSHLSWPRVHVECDFHGSAKFEDVLEITVFVSRLGSKSVTYEFEIMRGGGAIAKGRVIAVCCNVKSGHSLKSIAVPQKYSELLLRFCKSIDC